MLPLAHTYISTKVTGWESPLLILGSILPDISTTSSGLIKRSMIHDAPKEFDGFIDKYYPQLKDLGLGVRLHSQVDRGADFFSDDLKVGYAKIEGEKISADTASLLQIPENATSLTLAHNFIEMAIDLHIYKDNPEIWFSYKNALEDIEVDLPVVAECMGAYLKLEQKLLQKELDKLFDFLGPDTFVSEEAITKIAILLIKLRFGQKVSFGKTLKIVGKAMAITQTTYKQFLDKAVAGVRTNIIGKNKQYYNLCIYKL